MSSVPGASAICATLAFPVTITFATKTCFFKNIKAFLAAHFFATIVGLIGTVRILTNQVFYLDDATAKSLGFPKLEKHLTAMPSNGLLMHFLYVIAATAPFLGLIALIIAWRQKQIRIRSLIVIFLSITLIISVANVVTELKGACNDVVHVIK